MTELMKYKRYYLEGMASILFLSFVFLMSVFYGDGGHAVVSTGLLIILCILVPKRLIPWPFFLLFPFTAFIYNLGSENTFNLYDRILYYDKFAHLVTEFVLTLLAANILVKINGHTKNKPWLFFVYVASIGITLGVIWEIIEWLLTFYFPPTFAYTATDTATDLIVDVIGAVLAGWLSIMFFFKRIVS